MAEIWHIRKAPVTPEEDSFSDLEGTTRPRPSEDTGIYCVYDLTRERFLSSNMEGADFSPVLLESRLAALTPGSGDALWVTPYRGLSPTSCRFPIDLVTLNPSYLVLEAIESYPISLGSTSNSPAASALVLPAHTIGSIGVRTGDQLLVCTPEEMKANLRRLQSVGPAISSAPDGLGTDSEMRTFRLKSLGSAVYWEERIKLKGMAEPADGEASNSQEPSIPDDLGRRTQVEEHGWNGEKPRKSWWKRWISKKSKDPRRGARESLPGLIAYFFTGAQPAAHGIRNISTTGLYVLTHERWYLGTVIRVTLTDQRERTFERSITFNARVVRWGNDGVGLQAILRHKKDRMPTDGDLSGGMTSEEMEDFLRRYRDRHHLNACD